MGEINFFLVKSKAVSYAFYKGRDMVNGLKMVHNKFIIHICVKHLPKLWPGSK